MFRAWPKIPRLEHEVFHITEKIDGTNGCVIIQNRAEVPRNVWSGTPLTQIDGFGIWAQSRTRIVYPTHPDADNYGFAKWVLENAEELILDLGSGYHFGEWWGKGINRGYGLDHKRFSLFNPTKHSTVCYNVPLLAEMGKLGDCESVGRSLLSCGSIAAPGYMKPEGLVIYAERAKIYWKVVLDK